MPRTTTLLPGLLLAVLALAGGGCTTVRADFPGEDPAQLWTALVSAAESPDYGKRDSVPDTGRDTGPEAADETGRDIEWSVHTNEVWTDQAAGRIEIYREVHRTTDVELMRPLRETRTWRFQVRLDEDDPRVVSFRSRGASVPGKARAEGDRYFADVRRLLSRVGISDQDD